MTAAEYLLVAAQQTWSEAAVAIAGIALAGSVVMVVVRQLLATWRARMSGSQEEAYRRLAEQATDAQGRTATGLEHAVAELRDLREQLGLQPAGGGQQEGDGR